MSASGSAMTIGPGVAALMTLSPTGAPGLAVDAGPEFSAVLAQLMLAAGASAAPAVAPTGEPPVDPSGEPASEQPAGTTPPDPTGTPAGTAPDLLALPLAGFFTAAWPATLVAPAAAPPPMPGTSPESTPGPIPGPTAPATPSTPATVPAMLVLPQAPSGATPDTVPVEAVPEAADAGGPTEVTSTPPPETGPPQVEHERPAAVSSGVPAPAAPVPQAPAGPTAVSPREVLAQVVPSLTRLTPLGEGVHRMTLRLSPEGLGEVRVVLTVRDGAVQLRLAADDRVRSALAGSSDELVRALEQAGFRDHRITLASSDAQISTQLGSGSADQEHHRAGSELSAGHDDTGGRTAPSHDQRPGTDAGSQAKDGTPTHRADAMTSTPPDPHPDAATRGGLDVRA